MTVQVESARDDFARFWEWAGCEGDLDVALSEWGWRYNAVVPGGEAVPVD